MSDKLNQQIHDIRKPLNIISMQAELIRMINESGSNQNKIEDAANKIIQNARQCSELLQDMFEQMSNENLNISRKSETGE